MADTRDQPNPDNSGTRRTRAPTITIDTTAVNPSVPPVARSSTDAAAPHQSPSPGPDETTSPTSVHNPLALSWSSSDRTAIAIPSQGSTASSRPDLATQQSFDSQDARPQSPHNVSSPVTSRGHERAFLAVPQSHRSRQNSVDSEDGSRSYSSSISETVAASSSWQGDRAGGSSRDEASNKKIMEDEHALDPDQNNEKEFEVEENPFAFSPGQLNKMLNPKSLAAFYKLGGMRGLEKGLRTDRHTGLSVDEKQLDGQVTFEDATTASMVKANDETTDVPQTPVRTATSGTREASDDTFVDRKRVFNDNRLPDKKGKTFLQLVWITYNDKVLILLSVAAVVSLAIGLYQTFGDRSPDDPGVEWVEGVAIMVAIAIVVFVGSLNDWQKERQFAKLNRKKSDRSVEVIRSGKTMQISVYEILVGDVLRIQTGDMIPVDGVLIEGFAVKCDESSATGESDVLKKRSGDDVYAAIESGEDLKKFDPFLISGSKVMEGDGHFLVTSTGIHSSYGKTMMSLDEDPEITPLQSKLNVIAEYIAKLGGVAGLLLFLVLFIQFLVRLPKNTATPSQKGQEFLNIFIVVVTIIVVAVPEGLPLAVTLALAFATNRMMKDNNLVRHLKACEVMGNANTICSDKTGTLTQNKMQVVAGTFGTTHRFRTTANTTTDDNEVSTSPGTDSELQARELVKVLCSDVKDLLLKSVALNSTAFENEGDGGMEFVGSKTETALLLYAKDYLSLGPVSEERANAKVLQKYPFDSARKCMGIAVQLANGKVRFYVKGASEILLRHCTEVLRDPSKDLATAPLSDDNRDTLGHLIEEYASRSLRTIGLVYRDFDRWPPRHTRRSTDDRNAVNFEDIFKNMVFLGVVGIQDPLREGVPEAVRLCQKAGVMVRMVTGDNKLTAEAIAKECGILQPGGRVMEGPEFRNLSKLQQEEIIPQLQVLARSSPEDKRILVRRLKDMGQIVAVTGDGTNDAPALKLADVGFSMGISGTEVAKEASAIILMDDNFTSIVKALKWGRAVNDAVKRFLQFQLTVNVTAVVLTFVSAVSSNSESSVLTAVQLLWVNLIMDTLAALALATDPPQDSVLDRLPERRGASIISSTMWKMIIGQSIYQLVITLLIFYGSPSILGYDTDAERDQMYTLVFNAFVWMQIFNQWNNRRLDNNFNIFEGIFQNWIFIAINLAVSGAQILIIFFGGAPFNIAGTSPPQTGAQWAYAIILGFISIPVGALIRLIPDSLLESLIPSGFKDRNTVPGFTVSDEERFNSLPEPLADVRDELAFLKRIKGGRLNNLRFAMQHPRETLMSMSKSPTHSRTHSRSNSMRVPQTPTREDSMGSPALTPDSRKRSRSMRSRSNSALGAPTVMAGIIAGSVAAGWSPIDRSSDRDLAHLTRPHPSPSPLSHREDSTGLQPAPTFTEEPQEMEDLPTPAKQSSEVPQINVPTPPAKPRSSVS